MSSLKNALRKAIHAHEWKKKTLQMYIVTKQLGETQKIFFEKQTWFHNNVVLPASYFRSKKQYLFFSFEPKPQRSF